MLKCALVAHDKLFLYRNYAFNDSRNLMLKSKNAQISKNNFYICFFNMCPSPYLNSLSYLRIHINMIQI
jgi:hypothetical protein